MFQIKKFFPLLFAFFSLSKLYPQDLDLKWSERFQYDNKLDGYFTEFVGANKNFVYARFSNLVKFPYPLSQYKKTKLIAFDKKTMKKVSELDLNLSNQGYYFKTLVLNNIIYVIWTNHLGNIAEILAESYDINLKKITRLTKIFDITTDISGYRNLNILSNKKVGNNLLLVKQFETNYEKNEFRIEYKLIHPDLTSSPAGELYLTGIKNKRPLSYFNYNYAINDPNRCNFEYGEDGNLYIQQLTRLDDDEKKLLEEKESSVYSRIIQVNPESGKIQDFNIKFPKKNTFSFTAHFTTKGLKLFGFFSDLDIDKTGKDNHGLFIVTLSSTDFSKKNIKFSYFDKSFLDELFAADKENRKKATGLFKSKQAKESDEKSLSDNYIIEKIMPDGADFTLFCTIMHNWTRTVCNSGPNGGGSCHTYEYCTKSNVTVFKFNSNDELLWAQNLDRRVTYNGWNVTDLSVVEGEDDFNVIYGSAYQMNAKTKNKRPEKKSRQVIDRFEYAVFSKLNGQFRRTEYQINKLNTSKKDAKFVKQDKIVTFDNQMYVNCDDYKFKPWAYFTCLCPPVFLITLFNGNSRKGSGYLGSISPVN